MWFGQPDTTRKMTVIQQLFGAFKFTCVFLKLQIVFSVKIMINKSQAYLPNICSSSYPKHYYSFVRHKVLHVQVPKCVNMSVFVCVSGMVVCGVPFPPWFEARPVVPHPGVGTHPLSTALMVPPGRLENRTTPRLLGPLVDHDTPPRTCTRMIQPGAGIAMCTVKSKLCGMIYNI